jgi:two-component system OmpR family response regulator
MLVLLMEDDPDYADIVAHTIKRDHHDVVVVESVAGAAKFAERKPPEVAILDVLVPDGTGFDACRALRERQPKLPVIFLSSLNRSSDIVAGLEAGGDDYLTKPFHPSELLARLRAVTRRAGEDGSAQSDTRTVSANGIELDLRAHSARFDGVDLACTPIEVEILEQLIKFPGQALSHAFLTEQVWGYKHVSDATLLKGHVSSIRRKIRLAGGPEELVRTVHGVGYSFNPE